MGVQSVSWAQFAWQAYSVACAASTALKADFIAEDSLTLKCGRLQAVVCGHCLSLLSLLLVQQSLVTAFCSCLLWQSLQGGFYSQGQGSTSWQSWTWRGSTAVQVFQWRANMKKHEAIFSFDEPLFEV